MQGRGIRLLRTLALVALGAVLATAVVAGQEASGAAKPQPSPAISVRHGRRARADRRARHGRAGLRARDPLLLRQRVVRRRPGRRRGRARRSWSSRRRPSATPQRKCNKIKRKKPKRKCSKNPPLAVVLDIDETSLNYTELNAGNFANAQGALILAIASADSPAIGPTVDLYREARARGIAVFAVTGRPDSVESFTRDNLSTAGYTDLAGIYFKPSGEPTIAFKSASRAAIEQQGYRIVANVGDRERSRGRPRGPQLQAPNPFYFIE